MKKISLLIIDDSPLIKARIKDLLDDIGVIKQQLIARTFTEGLSLIDIYLPDVILLDINLPDGNGLKNLHYLKQTYPAIKIIIITNQDNEKYAQQSLDFGAHCFLDKSYDFHKLPSIIINISSGDDEFQATA